MIGWFWMTWSDMAPASFSMYGIADTFEHARENAQFAVRQRLQGCEFDEPSDVKLRLVPVEILPRLEGIEMDASEMEQHESLNVGVSISDDGQNEMSDNHEV